MSVPKEAGEPKSMHAGPLRSHGGPVGSPTSKETQKWYIQTVGLHPALKWKELLTQVNAWVNPENITLSEITQTQKDKYRMIPL